MFERWLENKEHFMARLLYMHIPRRVLWQLVSGIAFYEAVKTRELVQNDEYEILVERILQLPTVELQYEAYQQITALLTGTAWDEKAAELLEKMFACCGRNKPIKKSYISDICINDITSLKETQMNRPSITSGSPLMSLSFSQKNKNGIVPNKKEHRSTIKIKDEYPIDKSKICTKNKSNKSLRPTKTVICKRNEEDSNYILSLLDISFSFQKEERKENYSKLLLTGDLFFNKEIIINESGMSNSKKNKNKNKKDGYTMFGLKDSLDISGQLNNDFIINFKKDFLAQSQRETETGRVFEIKFNKNQKEYTLYFINPYLYLYYKINNFVYFYPGKEYFLFVGKIFIYITTEKKGGVQMINIEIDNTSVEYENKEYSFNENKSIITIGRINCDISIGEKCISKNHGIIEYSKINQKFYYKDMSSTNGTTLLIKKGDFLKLKGEMNFKLEDVSFKIQEIP